LSCLINIEKERRGKKKQVYAKKEQDREGYARCAG
jgi:hypothetical protein